MHSNRWIAVQVPVSDSEMFVGNPRSISHDQSQAMSVRNLPVWLSGLTCRLVYVRRTGVCAALIRRIVSRVISSSSVISRWCAIIFVRFRCIFSERSSRYLVIFAWFFSSASIDFGGLFSILEDARFGGGDSDGVCDPHERSSGA
jgi:hypothetical protein